MSRMEFTTDHPLSFEIDEEHGCAISFRGWRMFKVGKNYCKSFEYERLTDEGQPFQKFLITVNFLDGQAESFSLNGETTMRLVKAVQDLADRHLCPPPIKHYKVELIPGKLVKMSSFTIPKMSPEQAEKYKNLKFVVLDPTTPLPPALLNKPVNYKAQWDADERNRSMHERYKDVIVKPKCPAESPISEVEVDEIIKDFKATLKDKLTSKEIQVQFGKSEFKNYHGRLSNSEIWKSLKQRYLSALAQICDLYEQRHCKPHIFSKKEMEEAKKQYIDAFVSLIACDWSDEAQKDINQATEAEFGPTKRLPGYTAGKPDAYKKMSIKFDALKKEVEESGIPVLVDKKGMITKVQPDDDFFIPIRKKI